MTNPIMEMKKSKSGEFFVNLFEWCNLNCDFCWQDHSDWTGIETIVERSVDILDVIRKSNEKHFIINLMGGELFADKIPDAIFKDYMSLVQEIHTRLPVSKTIEINWVTNLIFRKTQRVMTLYKQVENLGIKTRITTSFDFAGRFKPTTKNIFKDNLKLFKKSLGTISIVLTKPNIEKLLLDDDQLFKDLYADGYYIYFDYYSPEKNYESMLPTDTLLQKALLFLLKSYPNVNPINSWINNDKNPMSCQSSTVIDHSGVRGKCRSLVEDKLQTKLKSDKNFNSNEKMENRFSEKYNCITCEFYTRCGMGCFLQHDFESFETLDECLYKEIFRSVPR